MKIDIVDIFSMGVSYGQLLMEEERDSEDNFDGFQGMIIDEKYSMPSIPAPRRQPHSEKWRRAKKEDTQKFFKLLSELSMQTVIDI